MTDADRQPTTIRLDEPRIDGQRVHFTWRSTPTCDIWLRQSFFLEFPDSVDLSQVPEGLWPRVMMLCLYGQWTLIDASRVVLPRQLPPEEIEVWQRMVDAGVWTNEANNQLAGDSSLVQRTSRRCEIVCEGPQAAPLTTTHSPGDLCVASFSGGRDSLTQLAILRELGTLPLLVMTRSEREGSIEFETERFEYVTAEAARRTGAELIEVRSDLRRIVDNFNWRAARYQLAVTEMTDICLYFANCLVVAAARGAGTIYLASESEIQTSARVDGMVIQSLHSIYAEVVHRSLTELFAAGGIAFRNMLGSLEHPQIHRLLALRYGELRDLQYSCYDQAEGEDVCCRCYNCFKMSLCLLNDGIEPSEVGLDLERVLAARRDWVPYGDNSAHAVGLVGPVYSRRLDDHLLRRLRAMTLEDVERLAPGGHLSDRARGDYERLRATAFSFDEPEPESGYLGAYVDLLPEPTAARLHEILGELFERDDSERGRQLLNNTVLLSSWITGPMRTG